MEAQDDVGVRKTKPKKQMSEAKSRELSGHDIFGSSPEVVKPRSQAVARFQEEPEERKGMEEHVVRNVRTSVKVSNVSIFIKSKKSSTVLYVTAYLA